ncbi:MAG: hypothetical protein WBA63_04895 [Thermomicrobiales bacterium]
MATNDLQRVLERLSAPRVGQRVEVILGAAPQGQHERLVRLSEIASEPIESLCAHPDTGQAIARKVEALEVLAHVHGLLG